MLFLLVYAKAGKVATSFLFCLSWPISKQLFNQRRSWNLIILRFLWRWSALSYRFLNTMTWVLCFEGFEIDFVFLCCFDPITNRHKEDGFQIEKRIRMYEWWIYEFWVYERLLGTLASWVFQLLGWLSFIWICEIWGDQIKFSSKRIPRYFTEIVELVFFRLVWS